MRNMAHVVCHVYGRCDQVIEPDGSRDSHAHTLENTGACAISKCAEQQYQEADRSRRLQTASRRLAGDLYAETSGIDRCRDQGRSPERGLRMNKQIIKKNGK